MPGLAGWNFRRGRSVFGRLRLSGRPKALALAPPPQLIRQARAVTGRRPVGMALPRVSALAPGDLVVGVFLPLARVVRRCHGFVYPAGACLVSSAKSRPVVAAACGECNRQLAASYVRLNRA